MKEIFMAQLHQDITEAFDLVDGLLVRTVINDPMVADHVKRAKDALFQARLLTDPEREPEPPPICYAADCIEEATTRVNFNAGSFAWYCDRHA